MPLPLGMLHDAHGKSWKHWLESEQQFPHSGRAVFLLSSSISNQQSRNAGGQVTYGNLSDRLAVMDKYLANGSAGCRDDDALALSTLEIPSNREIRKLNTSVPWDRTGFLLASGAPLWFFAVDELLRVISGQLQALIPS